MGSVTAAELQDVPETTRSDQAAASAVAFQDGIGGYGCAVGDEINVGVQDSKTIQGGNEAGRLIVGRGGNFADLQFAAGLIEHNHVCKRTADVNTNERAHAL